MAEGQRLVLATIPAAPLLLSACLSGGAEQAFLEALAAEANTLAGGSTPTSSGGGGGGANQPSPSLDANRVAAQTITLK